MRKLSSVEINSLIRLAYIYPKGHPERRDMLRVILRARRINRIASEKPIEEREFTHPKTKHRVKFDSLPPEEQKRLRGLEKDRVKSDEKEDTGKIEGWLNKAKNLSSSAIGFVKSLPDNTKRMIVDGKYRKETLSKAASVSAEKAKGLVVGSLTSMKNHVTDVYGCGKAVIKGEKPTEAQVNACITLMIRSATAAIAFGSGGTALGGAGAASKVFMGGMALGAIKATAKGMAATSLSENLKIPSIVEMNKKWGKTNMWWGRIQKALDGTGLSTLAGATIDGLVANSNSIKKANPSKEEEEFAQLMGQAGIQMLTDISDEQMIEALNAVSGANRKGSSLRTQIILLAHQKPSLRKELLHIL